MTTGVDQWINSHVIYVSRTEVIQISILQGHVVLWVVNINTNWIIPEWKIILKSAAVL